MSEKPNVTTVRFPNMAPKGFKVFDWETPFGKPTAVAWMDVFAERDEFEAAIEYAIRQAPMNNNYDDPIDWLEDWRDGDPVARAELAKWRSERHR